MAFLDGRIFEEPWLPSLSPEERTLIFFTDHKTHPPDVRRLLLQNGTVLQHDAQENVIALRASGSKAREFARQTLAYASWGYARVEKLQQRLRLRSKI
uniref:Uncharacterized protein n=1 Tax=Fusarium oxysporum (strain Fo5176) TaxID=660025 RepID=A0A0D2YFV8_FUSOF